MNKAQSSTKMSSLSIRVLNAVPEGEWRSREDVVSEVMYTIPPGEAFREGEARSRSTSAVRTRPREDLIHSGRRGKTIDIINSLVANGRLEQEERSGEKFLRLAERLTQIYVVRDSENNVTIHPINHMKVAIHMVDALATSDNPDEDLNTLDKIMHGIPDRLPGRQHVEEVCHDLMNKLRVDALLQNFDGAIPVSKEQDNGQ